MLGFLGKFLNSNEKEVNKLRPLVDEVNSLEKEVQKLKDKDLTKETERLRDQVTKGKSLDDILPRAYSLVREASQRVNKERHFDVQVLAAIALHKGKIAEQKTGEGKTLTASMPLYLNALSTKGVHLVTVNDYLAKVGVGWMGPIYHLLGMSTAAIIHDQAFIFDPDFADDQAADWRLRHLKPISRKEAYAADITYGINSEFGFDYLRDNMARSVDELVQRDFNYAIVDEVDSVLIDEARTPHIISAPDAEPTQKYYEYAKIVDKLTPKLDYVIDEKLRTAHLTDHGIGKVESLLGSKDIYENDFGTVHHIEAALKARTLFIREKDYIIRDNQVIIVDEFTGRLMPGRRWSEGIHQAIEAKENVPIQQESKTLATISLQNYFRKYSKLAGMTGTAATEAEEFHKIYNLDVVAVPTHRKMVRSDQSDQVYKSQRAKYTAVVKEIEEAYKRGQPVLVGTTSIDKNEIVTQFLRHRGIPHQILNAKQHEKEAMIISQAGKKGAVTIATNMAGRGVDIILGGKRPERDNGSESLENGQGIRGWKKEMEEWQKAHDEVVSLGGLHVVGTERHESRRIDNQLRGRAGRQGDPGSSRFFLALDDDVMRIFGGEQVQKLMTFFNIPEDQALEHGIVSRSIEQAQSKVEQFNFDSRKRTLEYDDVMNKQRDIIYSRRKDILTKTNKANERSSRPTATETSNAGLKDELLEKIDAEITAIVNVQPNVVENASDEAQIVRELSTFIPFDEASQKQLVDQLASRTEILDRAKFLQDLAHQIYDQREKQIGAQLMRYIEQQEMLRVIDTLWIEHLEAIDDLREGIGLRGYAQRDPLVEYKSEAFTMFEKLVGDMDSEIVHRIYRISVASPQQMEQMRQAQTNAKQIENIEGGVTEERREIEGKRGDRGVPEANKIANVTTPLPASVTSVASVPSHKKLGRNDPCPCGSGLKWKKCGLINSPQHQKNLLSHR